jgi:anion-transporting  ArsA/GET3 family ATPase
MRSLLERELVVVTGKGGVGKTTIAAALGILAATRGLRTIVVEVGEQQRLAELFGRAGGEPGGELELRERLSCISIDPDRALLEWLQRLGGRVPGRLLASSGTFQYFAAAAPGARELVSMVKIWELTLPRRWQRRAGGYDLVIVDAPATGNALGLLGSPHTFGAIARVGPIAAQTEHVRSLLEDPARSAYLAVALPTEMAVTEAIELREALRSQLGRDVSKVIVNGLLPQRFSADELRTIAALDDQHRTPRAGDARAVAERRLVHAAARAARSVHHRAGFQRNQLARLRRRGFEVASVSFAWSGCGDAAAIERVARQLGSRFG